MDDMLVVKFIQGGMNAKVSGKNINLWIDLDDILNMKRLVSAIVTRLQRNCIL